MKKLSLGESITGTCMNRCLVVVSRNTSIARMQVHRVMGAVEGIAYEWRGADDWHNVLFTGEADIAVCEAGHLLYPLADGLIVAALLKASQSSQKNLAVVCRSDCADLRGLFYHSDIRNSYGKVWLVGAGPGSADLITLRAIRALAQADVLYYDDLLDPSVRAYCPGEQVHVGKRKGRISHSQDSINEMLYRSVSEGKTVVRLKGGDPSIFGRAGEELDYLRRRWIAVEIVPGVTSASAASAAGLFSLTQRRISRSVTFLSGHSLDDVPHSPDKKTFVYYMAASKLEEVAHNLIREGVPSETPIVLVSNAGAWNEASVYSTVGTMSAIVAQPPALLIVGNVAACASIEKKALFTGIDPDSVKIKEPVVHQPLIMPVSKSETMLSYKTAEPRPTPLDLSYFAAVIFSSPETVDAFEEVYGNLPDRLLCYAFDSATREALRRYKVSPWRIVPCPIRGKFTDGVNRVA